MHTRETIENAIRSDPSCGVWAAVDVDFQNAFPSLLYGAIDSAVGARSTRRAAARSRGIFSPPCNVGVSLQISHPQPSQT